MRSTFAYQECLVYLRVQPGKEISSQEVQHHKIDNKEEGVLA